MVHRFGVFEFDDGSLELRKHGRLVALEPQPARALALLLGRAGEIVTRDELKAAVWDDGTHVDFDRGLAYCLSQIRGALNDKGDNPRFVQTLPRKGYCFVAPVQRDSAAPAGSAAAPQPARPSRLWLPVAAALVAGVALGGWIVSARRAAPARPVVAVSVFDNETGNPELDRLVAALSDAVVVRLANLAPSRLAVIGNAAVLRQPRNIRNLEAVAEGVHADFVVLGQLQRADTGYRFITHFIRLSDETHLRANRLPFPDGNLSTLESAVLGEIERAVRTYVIPSAS